MAGTGAHAALPSVTAYFIAFVAGIVTVVVTRVVVRLELGRAARTGSDPRTGRVAAPFFVQVVGYGVLLAGFFGVLNGARAGERTPVPVGALLAVMGIGMAVLLLARARDLLRRREGRRARRAGSDGPQGDGPRASAQHGVCASSPFAFAFAG